MNIQKRDGRIMPFDKTKIENAVLKAFKAVDTVDEVSNDHLLISCRNEQGGAV